MGHCKSHNIKHFIVILSLLIVKVLLLLMIVSMFYPTFHFLSDSIDSLPNLSSWKDIQDSYGIIPTLYIGDDEDVINLDINKIDIAINGDFYKWFNRRGAIYCTYEAQNSRTPLMFVNPNYLESFPIYDVNGDIIQISESETSIIILSPLDPVHDAEIVESFQNRREGLSALEQAYHIQLATTDNAIRIIHIAPSQRLFTFMPGNEYVENAIIQVITENNCLITERVCISGKGLSDPLKIYIGNRFGDIRYGITTLVKQLELDDNIKEILPIRNMINIEYRLVWKTILSFVIAVLFIMSLQLAIGLLAKKYICNEASH